MNNDELNDDAAFDAFLSGKGDLARALQAMPQASPSAELDAAILGRIRNSMAQQSTSAANDPGEASGMPMLASGLGRRWRVPAGLAATVLVGLMATQAYQQSEQQQHLNMPIEEQAVFTPAPQMAPPPVPEAAVDKAEVQAPVAEHMAPAAAPRRVPPTSAKTTLPAQRNSGFEAPVVASKPAPAPAAAPAVVPQPPPASAANATAAWEAARADTSIRAYATRELAKAAPPDSPSLPQASAPAGAPVAVSEAPTGAVVVSGSRIQLEEASKAAAEWVGQIEALLKDGKQDEARREWLRFRRQYPQYPSPPVLEAQMKALLE